ncbi:MAG: flavodoxin-dependent (E)-4-hydroxy-3-methylbut-2-enyl-diphosphate synthase [Clostridia bacterium]|nr:flavodoxin-dependent (E)-4-hydroxy-3-methylbut-2-enyl-diphosphate synthase [Clostridia bacterium]
MFTEYNKIRRISKEITVGTVTFGGENPIAIQSMTNTDTLDVEATYRQIAALEAAGCDVARLAIPTVEAASTIGALKKMGVKIPLVADIHFDYRIALACVREGIDKIRINPGNIGEEWKIAEVAHACKSEGIPIRIGVNGGSLEKHILEKYHSPTPDALAESAFFHAELLEKFGFNDIVLSVKTSDTRNMILANERIAANCNYPLHLGVTEAGDAHIGSLKSAVGIGSLLCHGIGDTVRVSLTADPVCEIAAAKEILGAVGIFDRGGIDIVSCPTCGRTKVNLIELAAAFREEAKKIDTKGKRIKVAVMGCAVNGPGEAREADIGIAGGIGETLLFRHGEPIGKVSEEAAVESLVREIRKLIEE